MSNTASFNPRTRVGCDPEGSLEAIKGFFVSIHAPAWGATTGSMTSSTRKAKFQSTHPRGVRLTPAAG